MVGQTVSHYRVVRRLGGGGMGEVYEAFDLSLGRHVAVKFLSSARAHSHESVLRFEREARAASALNHPHICTVHDFGVSGDRPFIVMELLDGQTLRDRLNAGRLDLPLIVDLGCQVADALEAAHCARIVHRDITPANIFVTRAGYVKILDFGLAKLAPEKDFHAAIEHGEAEETHEELLTSPGAALGTTAYMSPEQVSANPLDERTDLFSFGCVLYEMATGRRAFEGRTSALIFDAILRETPVGPQQLNPALPDELDHVIQKALEKDPELRYQTAREIRADLLRMMRGSAAAEHLQASGSGAKPAGSRRASRSHSGSAVAAPPQPLTAAPPHPGVIRRALPWLIAAAALAAGAAGYRWLSETSAGPSWTPSGLLTSRLAADLEPTLSPDGSTVAFTRWKDGHSRIWVVDIESKAEALLTRDTAGTAGAAPHHDEESPAWGPHDNMVYFVADHDGHHAIWKTPRMPGGAAVLVADDAEEPAVSPDGSRLAFVRNNAIGQPRIAVASLAGAGDARFVTGDSSDYGLWEHRSPAWSPDGNSICYRGQRDLFVVPASGPTPGTPRRLTADDARDEDPVWSPDGRFVLFSSVRENTTTLWLAPAGGGVARRVTLGTGPERHPTLSGDGNTLVYSAAMDDPDIVIHDLQTGTESRFGGTRDDRIPVFMPDQSGIVFVSNRSDDYRLWFQPTKGGQTVGEAVRLTDQPGTVACPTVSPDGKWVAYYRVFERQRDIWIAPIVPGPARPFTKEAATNVQPAWSPDGTRLAFVSDRSGINQIWTAGVRDGLPVGEPSQITAASHACWAPVWSPDGKTIAYVGSGGEGEVFVVPSDGRGSSRQVTQGAMAQRLRWNRATGTLFVAGGWGASGRLVLKEVLPEDGTVREVVPPVVFGSNDELYNFDVSADGRYLALSREEARGNLWSLRARRSGR